MKIVLIGFVIGVCISYSGVGAGSLTTPLIMLVLGVKAATAIGSDLVFSLGTKIVAFITHMHAKTVDYTALLYLSAGGVPGAALGVLVTTLLHNRLSFDALDHALRLALGFALLVSACAVFLTRTPPAGSSEPAAPLPRVPLALIGFAVGTLVSITSIGSGSLMLPLLLLFVSSSQLRRLIGTDVAFAVVVLLPAIAGHWRLGDVNLRLAGYLLAGSIPGVLVGAPLAKRLPERAFRVGLASILVAVGTRLVL